MSPYLRADLRPAIDHLATLTAEAPNKAAFADYTAAVTAFTAIESAYVPVGQTDTRHRDELRSLLKAAPVQPLVTIFREAIERHHRAIEGNDPATLSWIYIEGLLPIERFADSLGCLHARWLRATAYSALVAYGRPGGALPPPPAGLMIDVALVPDDKPRTRFVDEDDDEGGGVPVTMFRRR